MRRTFPQYATRTPATIKRIWQGAQIVLDANVLLNLYRYREEARDELLTILESLSERVWLPHHVALEFYRNRLPVLADQSKRFEEVRAVVEKTRDKLTNKLAGLQLTTRHSVIDPEPLTQGIRELTNDFLSGLEELRSSSQSIDGPDYIRRRLERIFDGKVGNPPSKQEDVDSLYAEAEKRFESRVPPGYLDVSKGNDAESKYRHEGIEYDRQYGDYLVWEQLLEFARDNGQKSVIFVTDDGKEDWWEIVLADGPRTIGPRLELVDEARMQAGITDFLMYRPERFLQYAREHLKATVSDGTIEEVRSVSAVPATQWLAGRRSQGSIGVEYAVYRWLKAGYSHVRREPGGPIDFVVEAPGTEPHHFAVRALSVDTPPGRIRGLLRWGLRQVVSGQLPRLTIVLAGEEPRSVYAASHAVARHFEEARGARIQIIVGTVSRPDHGVREFLPVDFFDYEAINSIGAPARKRDDY